MKLLILSIINYQYNNQKTRMIRIDQNRVKNKNFVVLLTYY